MATVLVAHSDLVVRRMILPVLFTLLGLVLTIASASLVFGVLTLVLLFVLAMMVLRSLVFLRPGAVRPGFGLSWIQAADIVEIRLAPGPAGEDSQIVVVHDETSTVVLNCPPGVAGPHDQHASEMKKCLVAIERHLSTSATE